jgi:hypothetical protein
MGSKYTDSKVKTFATEKEANAFLQSGEVGHVIALNLRRNDSFVLFYLPYVETVTEEKTENTKLKKGLK